MAARGGNPVGRLRPKAREAWAIDYDTLVRLDLMNWSLKDKLLLQPRDAEGGGQFVGEWSFNRDDTLCAVARPFSGDVVGVETATFRQTYRAAIGRQPLDVELLSDGRIIARDWRTGDMLRGALE